MWLIPQCHFYDQEKVSSFFLSSKFHAKCIISDTIFKNERQQIIILKMTALNYTLLLFKFLPVSLTGKNYKMTCALILALSSQHHYSTVLCLAKLMSSWLNQGISSTVWNRIDVILSDGLLDWNQKTAGAVCSKCHTMIHTLLNHLTFFSMAKLYL